MLMNHAEYFKVLETVKAQILSAQHKAALGVNKELILLYWQIGNVIIENSQWGNKFIENLAKDIKADFPDASGYSVRNLKYMRQFASVYTDLTFVQSVTAQIPWTHNKSILDKVKEPQQMAWYINKTAENGWSVHLLEQQIATNLYERQQAVNKTTNYPQRLTSAQSELAQQILKDPYIFDFIETKEKMIERDIEQEMVANVSSLLLELGTGFAFLGNQYHLEIGGEDFYIDLLFYNTSLHCYFVIELKCGVFKPEYAGKLNFYLSAVDDLLKKDCDNPSIGLILCRDRNKTIAEYALRDMTKPIGVSEYRLTESLPTELENALPSVEDIERRVRQKYNPDNDLVENGEETR